MNENYTLKEIFEKRFKDMEEKITENHNGMFDYLRRIEEQTKKTNGRVTKIEKILLVVGVAGAVLAVVYFPQILTVLKVFL